VLLRAQPLLHLELALAELEHILSTHRKLPHQRQLRPQAHIMAAVGVPHRVAELLELEGSAAAVTELPAIRQSRLLVRQILGAAAAHKRTILTLAVLAVPVL
jgi:hypothetical protein